VYFSQRSGGEWVEASDLEFMTGSNKSVVYSSKSGHASFLHPGNYLQGSEKYSIGVRNDTDKSEFAVDSKITNSWIILLYFFM
jgi:Vacuolar protein sorting-associated protein 62